MSEPLSRAVDDESNRANRFRARKALIIGSGFFDAEWYRAHHQSADEHDLAPLDHYLTRGIKSVSCPGPLFDSESYLEDAWHLRRGVDDPLEHFLSRGADEGRVVRPRPHPNSAGLGAGTSELLLSSYASTVSPRVAAVVHAFHPDLFAEVCSVLAFLPSGANVLVSTDDETKADRFRREYAEHETAASLEIAVTPNRGRNFGPMLTRFRDALRQHDLLVHLHTKKADYRGAQQDSWRSRLLRSLLPSAATVSTLIRRFHDDRHLGVLTATPGDAVRYWAYNWLSNRSQVQSLLRKLDLSLPIPETMFDYPVGGMFWARTDAIRPLLEHEWRWEDFPEEAGQIDGTLAHAIERVIVLMARTQGYRFDEIDYPEGIIRCGWSSRNLHQYHKVDRGALYDTILRSTIVSFGVDGTLRLSVCLFERHLNDYIRFLERRSDPENLVVGLKSVRKIEDVRSRLRYVRPIIAEGMRYAKSNGRRIIVVDNGSSSTATAKAFLDEVGLRDVVDAVYDRRERRIGDDDEVLWRLVIRNELVATVDGDAPSLFHIGADAHLDIQKTADLGLPHFHVLTPTELLLAHGLYPRERDGADMSTLGDSVLLGIIGKKLFSDPFIDGRGGEIAISTPEDLGFIVFGPMLFAFLAFVIRQADGDARTRTYFLAREGWFLGRLYAVMTRAAGRTNAAAAQYFHCSRRCVLAALQADGVEAEPVLQGAGFRGTIRDFLAARLGVSTGPNAALERNIELPDDRDVIRRTMDLLHRSIVEVGSEQLTGLSRYAEAQGMTGEGLHAFVDIGYSATVQDGLQRLIGVRLDGLYMGVSHAAARVGRGGGYATGCFADGDADLSGFTGTFGLMLEAFLTAPHGQVVGYGTGAEVLFRDPARSQHLFPVLERIYRGVEAYAIDVIAIWGPDVVDVPMDPRIATSMMRALREGRMVLAKELASTLTVEDDFCGMGEIPVYATFSPPGST